MLGPAPEVTVLPLVSIPDRPGGRNGLVDGVGLDVLGIRDGAWELAFMVPTGGNRDGTVPALALRAGLFNAVSDGIRSGNPS